MRCTCVTLARVLHGPQTQDPQNCVIRHDYKKAKSINEYILGRNPDVAQHVAGYCLYTGVMVTVILSSCPCEWRCLRPWGVPRWRDLQKRPQSQSLFIRLRHLVHAKSFPNQTVLFLTDHPPVLLLYIVSIRMLHFTEKSSGSKRADMSS